MPQGVIRAVPRPEPFQSAREAHLRLEAGFQERLRQFVGETEVDDPPSQAQHVEVVVLHALTSRVDIVAHGGTDSLQLVGSHAGADAAAAYDNSPLHLTFANLLSDRDRVVRIVVVRIELVSAHVDQIVAGRDQSLDERFLEDVAGVVGPDRDAHCPQS